jgi:hypothetical protein
MEGLIIPARETKKRRVKCDSLDEAIAFSRLVSQRSEDNNGARYFSKDEESKLRKVISTKYSSHLPEFEFTVQTGIRQGTQYNLTWEMKD